MWLSHAFGFGDGAAGIVAEVVALAVLGLHSLCLVLILGAEGPRGPRLAWGLALLVPVAGPVAYLAFGRRGVAARTRGRATGRP